MVAAMKWVMDGGYKAVLALLLAVLIAGAGWYVSSLRGGIAQRDRTIAVLEAAAQKNSEAIAALRVEKTRAEAALTADAAAQKAIGQAVPEIKERVRYVQIPGDCQAADDRDRAVLDGVRGLLAVR